MTAKATSNGYSRVFWILLAAGAGNATGVVGGFITLNQRQTENFNTLNLNQATTKVEVGELKDQLSELRKDVIQLTKDGLSGRNEVGRIDRLQIQMDLNSSTLSDIKQSMAVIQDRMGKGK